MWQRQDFSLPAGHPSAVGHFPGDPIIPGALLLDAMVVAIAGAEGVVAIQTAKFLRPARFGQPLQLRWQAQGGGQFRFECRHGPDESMVLAGMLAVSGTAA
jgi:3-hydroxymyristoyl/3-hydroxydecanoyl-(acyl carrier protein) dehydratase